MFGPTQQLCALLPQASQVIQNSDTLRTDTEHFKLLGPSLSKKPNLKKSVLAWFGRSGLSKLTQYSKNDTQQPRMSKQPLRDYGDLRYMAEELRGLGFSDIEIHEIILPVNEATAPSGFSSNPEAQEQGLLLENLIVNIINQRDEIEAAGDELNQTIKIMSFGIGDSPHELRDAARIYFNALERSGLQEPGWKLVLYGYDNDVSTLEEANQYFNSMSPENIQDRIGITWDEYSQRVEWGGAHKADFNNADELKEIVAFRAKGQLADIILYRNLSYSNVYIEADTTLEYSSSLDVSKPDHNRQNAIVAASKLAHDYQGPRNILLAAGQNNSHFIIEPGNLDRQSAWISRSGQVFSFAGLDIVLGHQLSKKFSYIPGQILDQSTGIYRVDDLDIIRQHEKDGIALQQFQKAIQATQKSRMSDTSLHDYRELNYLAKELRNLGFGEDELAKIIVPTGMSDAAAGFSRGKDAMVQAGLLEDLIVEIIEQRLLPAKKGVAINRNLSFMFFGLGEKPNEIKDAIRIYFQALQRAHQNPRDWRLELNGFDNNQAAIDVANRYIAGLIAGASTSALGFKWADYISSFIWGGAHLVDFNEPNKLKEITQRISETGAADIVFYRNVNDANASIEDDRSNRHGHLMSFNSKDPNSMYTARDLTYLYQGSRNILLAAATEGTHFVIDPGALHSDAMKKYRSGRVFGLAGLQNVSLSDLGQTPVDDIHNQSTGIYRVDSLKLIPQYEKERRALQEFQKSIQATLKSRMSVEGTPGDLEFLVEELAALGHSELFIRRLFDKPISQATKEFGFKTRASGDMNLVQGHLLKERYKQHIRSRISLEKGGGIGDRVFTIMSFGLGRNNAESVNSIKLFYQALKELGEIPANWSLQIYGFDFKPEVIEQANEMHYNLLNQGLQIESIGLSIDEYTEGMITAEAILVDIGDRAKLQQVFKKQKIPKGDVIFLRHLTYANQIIEDSQFGLQGGLPPQLAGPADEEGHILINHFLDAYRSNVNVLLSAAEAGSSFVVEPGRALSGAAPFSSTTGRVFSLPGLKNIPASKLSDDASFLEDAIRNQSSGIYVVRDLSILLENERKRIALQQFQKAIQATYKPRMSETQKPDIDKNKPLAIIMGPYPVSLAQKLQDSGVDVVRFIGDEKIIRNPLGPLAGDQNDAEMAMRVLMVDEDELMNIIPNDRRVALVYDQIQAFHMSSKTQALREMGFHIADIPYNQREHTKPLDQWSAEALAQFESNLKIATSRMSLPEPLPILDAIRIITDARFKKDSGRNSGLIRIRYIDPADQIHQITGVLKNDQLLPYSVMVLNAIGVELRIMGPHGYQDYVFGVESDDNRILSIEALEGSDLPDWWAEPWESNKTQSIVVENSVGHAFEPSLSNLSLFNDISQTKVVRVSSGVLGQLNSLIVEYFPDYDKYKISLFVEPDWAAPYAVHKKIIEFNSDLSDIRIYYASKPTDDIDRFYGGPIFLRDNPQELEQIRRALRFFKEHMSTTPSEKIMEGVPQSNPFLGFGSEPEWAIHETLRALQYEQYGLDALEIDIKNFDVAKHSDIRDRYRDVTDKNFIAAITTLISKFGIDAFSRIMQKRFESDIKSFRVNEAPFWPHSHIGLFGPQVSQAAKEALDSTHPMPENPIHELGIRQGAKEASVRPLWSNFSLWDFLKTSHNEVFNGAVNQLIKIDAEIRDSVRRDVVGPISALSDYFPDTYAFIQSHRPDFQPRMTAVDLPPILLNPKTPKDIDIAYKWGGEIGLLRINSNGKSARFKVGGQRTQVFDLEHQRASTPFNHNYFTRQRVTQSPSHSIAQTSFSDDLSKEERALFIRIEAQLKQSQLDDIVWVLDKPNALYAEALGGAKAWIESIGGHFSTITETELLSNTAELKQRGRRATYLLSDSLNLNGRNIDIGSKGSAWVYSNGSNADGSEMTLPRVRLNILYATLVQLSNRASGEELSRDFDEAVISQLATLTFQTRHAAKAYLEASRDLDAISAVYLHRAKPFLLTTKVLATRLAAWTRSRLATLWSA
ncbi:MAG: hypothetical protein ACI9Y8_000745 [Candidatus Omnitrophota bacterium]|jgi:hypothetical protein